MCLVLQHFLTCKRGPDDQGPRLSDLPQRVRKKKVRKEKDKKAYVIEINDNPNIDSDVEDAIAGMDLYHNVIHEFVRRIEAKK